MDKPVTTRVPLPLYRAVKKEAKTDKTRMYEVFTEALRLWLVARSEIRKLNGDA